MKSSDALNNLQTFARSIDILLGGTLQEAGWFLIHSKGVTYDAKSELTEAECWATEEEL